MEEQLDLFAAAAVEAGPEGPPTAAPPDLAAVSEVESLAAVPMGDQLDLFAAAPVEGAPDRPLPAPRSDPAAMSDAELLAALPQAGLTTAPGLAAEAGRRRLGTAVPALDRLCRRLVLYGAARPVPEQLAALSALAAIGDAAARVAVARLFADRIVEGPGLVAALAAAAALGARLATGPLSELLHHPDPAVRAGACRCAHPSGALIGPLIELLDDPDSCVGAAAACALGHAGRSEARPVLVALLRRAPSAELIEALVPVADPDAVVLVARVARARPDLAPAALDALDRIDHPNAAKAAAALRKAAAVAAAAGPCT
jgi:HEAT repeat protein